MTPAELCVS